MYKTQKILFVLAFIVAFAPDSDALWNMERYELPDSVKAINNTSDLGAYLTSPNEFQKILGIIRLGEIGTSQDFPVLLDLYNNETHRWGGVEGLPPGIKHFSIKAISQIGGPNAESIILAIAEDYGYGKSKDSTDTFIAICDELGKLESSKAKSFLDKVYNDHNYGRVKRMIALKNSYLIDLKTETFSNSTDSVDFLIDKIENGFSQDIRELENYIITKAVKRTLIEIYSNTISEAIRIRTDEIVANDNLKAFMESFLRINDIQLENQSD
ncbi:MAG: hypothetical protein GY839_03080 [candidate division Zixibacteria bacterium]|nr:hypothetical protein [candidate division Zixibacteria bacterium]